MDTDLELYPEKTMTIKQLAEVLEITPRTIQLKVKELFPDIIRYRETTYLNEKQVTVIKLACEKKFAIKTDLEKELIIQQALIFQAEKIKSMQLQITEMIPKAEFFDRVTESRETIDIGNVAQTLNIPGIGRNKLFALLRGINILKSDNTPYQEYVDRGYFKTVEVETVVGIKLKTVVYQKGLHYISKKLGEDEN